MVEYLRERPDREFAEGKFNRVLEVLEQAGGTGSREPVALYELYLSKDLDKRAADYRRRCEATFSYDLRPYFEQVDRSFVKSR